jgi:chromosome segregation ATPase
MTNDQLVERLERLRSYNSGPLNHDDREVLRAAVAAIRTSDTALAEAMPHLSTLSDLLKVVIDPKKCEAAVARLTELVNEASAMRKAAAEAAADLEHKQATIGPSLASARAAHERSLADKTADFDKRVSQYQKSLSDRQALLDSREQLLAANEAKVEKLRTELQEKLDRIRSVAA